MGLWGSKINKYDCSNGLDFDFTAFATPKSYAVAADSDSAYAATVNIAESDDAATSATFVGVAAANLIHGSIVKGENDFV